MITKVTPHISQNELLIFERSSPGKKASRRPELADSVLLCATEMTKRSDMDLLAEVLQ